MIQEPAKKKRARADGPVFSLNDVDRIKALVADGLAARQIRAAHFPHLSGKTVTAKMFMLRKEGALPPFCVNIRAAKKPAARKPSRAVPTGHPPERLDVFQRDVRKKTADRHLADLRKHHPQGIPKR